MSHLNFRISGSASKLNFFWRKSLSLAPVWYWLISQRDESARFATKWPESSRVSTFAKVHDQMPLFFARAKGPTISANRDMRNSNRKLINVHDAKRIVNLSKKFPATPFKMKVWLLFYKVVFFWCLQCSNDSQCTPKNRDLWIPLLSGLLAARWRFLSSKQRRNEHVFF